MIDHLSAAEARRIAVRASFPLSPMAPPQSGEPRERIDARTAEVIERLGSIQIDTIHVVERAHHHALWSRVPGYDTACLGRLEAEPRRIIEYWSHAAAYLPLSEYRYCLPRQARIRSQGHEWFKADKVVAAGVLERIRTEGPMCVSDFGGSAKSGGAWWDWNPVKIALEYLFHAGILVSSTRKNFRKVYDLAERALPRSLDLRMPDSVEMAARHVDRAISALGIFAAEEVAYLRKDGRDGIAGEIAARTESGYLVEVRMDDGLTRYATPDALERALSAPFPVWGEKPQTIILSPFDSLVIDRKRTKRLFGLEYGLECYVPEQKRRFGYFALPILYADHRGEVAFAGLMDAKADQRSRTLFIKRMELHPEGRAWKNFADALLESIRAFAAFNGCASIELERLETGNRRLQTALTDALRRTASAK